MTTVVLDTHAWVWWLTRPEKLSRAQRSAVERARREGRDALCVSVISCWEVALLAQAGRLRFSVPVDTWLAEATDAAGCEVLQLSLPIILTASRLTMLRDPADMLIVASALHHGARLITSDARIGESAVVPVIG